MKGETDNRKRTIFCAFALKVMKVPEMRPLSSIFVLENVRGAE
jgi:hypothetical protein